MEGYKDYQIIIRIPLKAVDDPDARMKARCVIHDLHVEEVECLYTAKLQRLNEGKPPEGIVL